MRATLAFLPALLITLALFCLMHYMVSGRAQDLKPVEAYGVVDFVRLQPAPDKTVSARPQRPLPERLQAPADAPSLPILAAEPLLKPAQPELAAETPSPGKVALGEPPTLRSLVLSVPKPQVVRAPTVPPSTSPQGSAPADVAIRSPSPDVPGVGGRPDSPVGGLNGLETAVPGLGAAEDGEVVALFRLEPEYPRKAAMSGTEGWVRVAFTINERGAVTEAVVVDSKPSRIFDRSALRAIRKWRFKPMVADGKAVARRATQLLEFKLAGK